MARITAQTKKKKTKNRSNTQVGPPRAEVPKKEDRNDVACTNEHQDCTCYLRRGLFLPPALNEDQETSTDADNSKS